MKPSLRIVHTALQAVATGALILLPVAGALSQTAGAIPSGQAAQVAPPPSAPGPAESARYVEACQQGIERGVVNPGCQGPIYASEIARLKEDALRTNNPSLLTLVGEAYQSPRGGLSDIAQAYRWYLLGAVRGDPLAMQRLSELYKNGRGAPQDNVKALGYARLTQRLSLPGSDNARHATETISILGSEMAAEEVALAERFADELERDIQTRTGTRTPLAPPPTAAPAAPQVGRKALSGLPGLGAAQPGGTGVINLPPAGPAGLPGIERLPEPQRQP